MSTPTATTKVQTYNHGRGLTGRLDPWSTRPMATKTNTTGTGRTLCDIGGCGNRGTHESDHSDGSWAWLCTHHWDERENTLTQRLGH